LDIESIINLLDECSDALRKQQFKRLKTVYVNNANFASFACPTCDNVFQEKYQLYCSKCGQKVDWGMPDFLD
jgi:Zn finger protein HypA/HybF involved in hydrogenase expression